jgi:diguanylate cyclase
MNAGWESKLRERLWPRVPDAVRDDLSMLRYESLRSQIPMLYAMLILLIAVTLWGTPAPTNRFIAWALPIVMSAVITVRILIWHRRWNEVVTPDRARAMVKTMTISSCGIGVVASFWGVGSWLTAPPHLALYYPMLLAMGSLSAAYCVSNVRSETILNLIIGLFPISGVMIFTGSTMDVAAGAAILIAALFLMRMIVQQHARLIDQLLMERQMRTLANTDELTGLLNRRALKAQISNLIDERRPLALILFDLDGFKAVNDQHGHGAGDALLCEIGARLQSLSGTQATVARLGGDEFAMLLPGGNQAAAQALTDATLVSLIQPIVLPEATVRIGASAGIAAVDAASDINALFSEADRALYAAKRRLAPSLARTLGGTKYSA